MRSYLNAMFVITRSNGIASAAAWILFTALNVRKTLRLMIGGRNIFIRAATPDCVVAIVTLCHEFEDLFRICGERRPTIIFDAGGYIGTAAIAFATRFPDAKVVTIEPSADNFAILEMNVAPYKNIVAVNKAVCGHAGMANLKSRGTGEWGFTIVDRPEDNETAPVIQKVECTTVERLMADLGVEAIDIFKIDIEGGEFSLFRDKPSWLDRTGVVLIEIHDRIVSGCSSAFREATEGRHNIASGEKVISVAPWMTAGRLTS
jgi:FkbM family methyltransferase